MNGSNKTLVSLELAGRIKEIKTLKAEIVKLKAIGIWAPIVYKGVDICRKNVEVFTTFPVNMDDESTHFTLDEAKAEIDAMVE